jgi:hypothetical protein
MKFKEELSLTVCFLEDLDEILIDKAPELALFQIFQFLLITHIK